MKKKKRGRKKRLFKGFTMVELLVAMAIMSLLLIMAFPVIRSVQTNNTNKKFDEYGKSAISAAKLYVDSYGDDLFEPDITNQFKPITFNDMVKKGLLKDINLSDSTCINNSSVIVVKYKDDYSYCLHLVCKTIEGDSTIYEENNRKGSCQNFKTVKVTYVYNDNGLERRVDKEIIKGEDQYMVLSPSQVGFNLSKNHEVLEFWEEAEKGISFKPGDIINESINSNITLVAKTRKFIYTINYDKGLGTGTMEPTKCAYGSSCILKNNTFKKDYFTYTNWVDSETNKTYSGGENVKETIGNRATLDGKIFTVVASYRKNTVKIKYNSNGGSLLADHSSSITLSGNKVLVKGNEIHHTMNYDGKLTSDGLINWNNPNYLNLSRTGYTVKSGEEWNSNTDGTGRTYNQTSVYSGSELCPDSKNKDCETIMYTKWLKKKVTVIFNCNGGTGGGSQEFTYGESPQSFNITCTKSGFNQDGWKLSTSSTTKNYTTNSGVSDSWIDTYSPSVTLYAHWVPSNVYITYNGNGATSGSTATTTCQKNTNCTLAANGFDKKGYAFDGWYTSASGGSKYGQTTNINKSITVYAHWRLTHPYYNSAGNYYTLLQTAINETPTNGIIYLQQNYNDTGKAKLNTNKKLTFDARGYTLNLTKDNIEVANGELTLKNGTINTSTEDNSAILCSGGKINIISGVTIHCSYITNKELGTQAIKITNGTVNMSGGTVSSGEGAKSGYAKCVHLTGGSFIMSGGKIIANATKSSGHGGTGINNSGGTVTIKSGATIESKKGGKSRCGVCGNSGKSIIKSGATVNINDHVTNGKAPAVLWAGSGKICYENGVNLGCKGATRCVSDSKNITKKGKGKC